VRKIEQRAAEMVGMALENVEPLQLVSTEHRSQSIKPQEGSKFSASEQLLRLLRGCLACSNG